VGSLIKSLNIPPAIMVSYRAFFPEVHVLLKGEVDELHIAALADQAKTVLGSDFVLRPR